MAVVIGEFDVIEQPTPGTPAAPASPPAAAPPGAADLDRMAAQQLQRELRCHVD